MAAWFGLIVVATSPELDRAGWPAKLATTFGAGAWSFYLGSAALAGSARRFGALGGLDVPANWTFPFVSGNLLIFWRCRNITLVSALCDMVFYNR